jgi:putative tricarboxylic transport membrane protein
MDRRSLLWLALSAALSGTVAHAQPTWQPQRPVEIVVGSGPGGGNDRNARILQKLLHDNKWLHNVTVINKVGGGGALSYTYVNGPANDAHYLVFVRQGFLSNHILGRSAIGLDDMTPLATLNSEASALVVRAGTTALKSIADVMTRVTTW